MWLVAFKAAAGWPVSLEERRNSAAVVAVLVTAEVSRVRAIGLEMATTVNYAVTMPCRGRTNQRDSADRRFSKLLNSSSSNSRPSDSKAEGVGTPQLRDPGSIGASSRSRASDSVCKICAR